MAGDCHKQGEMPMERTQSSLFWNKLVKWQVLATFLALFLFWRFYYFPSSCTGDRMVATSHASIYGAVVLVMIILFRWTGPSLSFTFELAVSNAFFAVALATAMLDWTNEGKVLMVMAYFVWLCFAFRPAERDAEGIKQRTFHLSFAVQFFVVLLAMLLI